MWHLSIVVPSFNGADWLGNSLQELDAFVHAQTKPTELILVDDCSGPLAARMLQEFADPRPWMTLLRNERNRGKGYSVARGMLAARGRYRVFTDADLAYPVSQIERVLRLLEHGAEVALVNRVHDESRYTMSPSYFHYLYSRHLMSRALNAAVRTLVLPGIHDTQAGLKGFAAHAAEALFSRVTVPGFGFDIELLVLAKEHGYRLVESPVDFRYDDEPTTVRFARDVSAMLRDLVRIARNRRRGLYVPRVHARSQEQVATVTSLANAH